MILGRDSCYWGGRQAPIAPTPPWGGEVTADWLRRFANDYPHVRQLFLTPGAAENTAAVNGGRLPLSSGTGMGWFSSVRSPGSRLNVYAPSLDETGSPWDWQGVGRTDVAELWTLAEVWITQTGTAWCGTGGLTSDMLLLRSRRGRINVPDMPNITQPVGGRRPLAREEPGLRFARPMGRGEFASRWCHTYDVNAMYLAAARDARWPFGRWRATTADQAPPTMTGWYEVEPGALWVTTPTARTLDLDPRGRFIGWDDSAPVLRSWADKLVSLRAMPGMAPIVKAVYTAGIGRLGSRQPTTMPRNPYAQQEVWARARLELARKIEQVRHTSGRRPIAANIDQVYYLASVDDPIEFARRIGLPLGDRPGQLKYTGSIPGLQARAALKTTRPTRELLRLMSESAVQL